jgi:hypothetical protein
MQRRSSYVWALGAFLVATVLGLDGDANQTVVADTNSVSSPSFSNTYFESAALCDILAIQFHGCTHALQPKTFHLFHGVLVAALVVIKEISRQADG